MFGRGCHFLFNVALLSLCHPVRLLFSAAQIEAGGLPVLPSAHALVFLPFVDLCAGGGVFRGDFTLDVYFSFFTPVRVYSRDGFFGSSLGRASRSTSESN